MNTSAKANALRICHTSILKFFALSISVSLSLLAPQLSYAEEVISFESVNYPDRFIRHRNFLGYVDPVVVTDKLGRQDATFHVVPGLAGKCSSFESINYPDHFLRHQDFRLKLAKREDTQLFKEDATFCLVPCFSG
jgi:hypothetical protein